MKCWGLQMEKLKLELIRTHECCGLLFGTPSFQKNFSDSAFSPQIHSFSCWRRILADTFCIRFLMLITGHWKLHTINTE